MTKREKGAIPSAIALITAFLIGLVGCGSGKQQDTSSPVHINVSNGGFEASSLAPWSPWLTMQAKLSSDKVHSGKSSVAEDSGKGSLYQDVTGLEEGALYIISAWVCGSPGANSTGQIAAYDAASNIATYSPEVTPKQTWEQVKHQVRGGAKGSIRVHLFHNDGSGTIYWDDVEVNRVNQ